MTTCGTAQHPLRVAIIGSGPAAFYVAEQLLRRDDVTVEVDMYERLPTPYGLVRLGVAPDHPKIKSVTRVYDKVGAKPGFRFFGNVEMGRQLSLDDLGRHYHQICFATGAQTDRTMGIPGEALARSHAATEFVAWYNGHPDYRHCTFDLAVERVAIVGVGNVAVDVARILCRTPDELARTDIADYALEALTRSRVREIYMLGRRGPAQAAFTNPEVRELGEMPGADVVVRPDEVALDAVSAAALAQEEDRAAEKKLEILREFAARRPAGRPRTLFLRFLVSPVALLGDADGRVTGMRLVRNELYRAENGALRPRATQRSEDLPVELVFRSVGYRGVAIPGLPFDARSGVVPNAAGRVLADGGRPLAGLYVAGWIKRGATGVIGTNKPDAAETVEAMLEDVAHDRHLAPPAPDAAAAASLARARCGQVVTFPDWQRLDRLETSRGAPLGRPRVKFTSVEEMLEQLRDTDT